MRALGLFVVVFPMFSLPCLADSAGKAEPLADCAALIASIPDVTTTQDTVIEDIDGGCRATNLSWSQNSYVQYRADEIILLSPDLLRTLPTGELFVAADLTLKGVRAVPQTNSPLQDYIISLNSTGIDLHLAYTTDPADRTGKVDFELDAGRLGRLALSAKLTDLDTTDVRLTDLTEVTGRLDHLEASLEDEGLVASIFAPPILSTLPFDEDPRPAIAAGQEAVVAKLESWPEATMTPKSLAVLSDLIRAFPKPEGDWTVTIDSNPGISLQTLYGGTRSAFAGALEGTTITATGGPAAQ